MKRTDNATWRFFAEAENLGSTACFCLFFTGYYGNAFKEMRNGHLGDDVVSYQCENTKTGTYTTKSSFCLNILYADRSLRVSFFVCDTQKSADGYIIQHNIASSFSLHLWRDAARSIPLSVTFARVFERKTRHPREIRCPLLVWLPPLEPRLIVSRALVYLV